MLIPLSMPGWPVVPAVDPLVYLALLIGIPVGISLILTLLVVLPALARRGRAGDEETRAIGPDDEPLWLGGESAKAPAEVGAGLSEPTAANVETDQDVAAEPETGGTSARW